MEFYSLIPFLAVNLACFVLACWVLRGSGFYRRLVDEAPNGRAQMIDGLRGWLALGVFFTHAAAIRAHFTSGTWDISQTPFYRMTGEVGVSLFFMITGFLFWGRVLRSGDRFGAKALYVSRLRRIMPMYLVSVLVSLAVVAVQSGFTLNVSLSSLVRELLPWFSLGFGYAGPVNGIQDAHHIDAVYWTLAYESVFYLVLPLLALLARRRLGLILLPLAILYGLHVPVILNFIFGGLTALLMELNLIDKPLQSRLLGALAIGLLVAVFTFPTAYARVPICLLFVFFLLVVKGNSLFGLLASRAARCLGAVSYSIYLMHCIAVYSIVTAANAWLPIRLLETWQFWSLAGVAAMSAVLISMVTYRYVEHPFLSSAKRSGEPERNHPPVAVPMGVAP